jgi:hypothetical protein
VTAFKAEVVKKAGGMNPIDIANFVWGLAKAGEKLEPALVEAVSTQALARIAEFTPVSLSNVMWAFAATQTMPNSDLLRAFEGVSLVRKDEFKPQNVSNLLWSLAMLKLTPAPELLQAMRVAALRQTGMGHFKALDVVQLAWALAMFKDKERSAELVAALVPEALAVQITLRDHEKAALSWALKTLDAPSNEELDQALLKRKTESGKK